MNYNKIVKTIIYEYKSNSQLNDKNNISELYKAIY